jgi:hypothetical protein
MMIKTNNTMDIKKHILSMAPEAQNMLLRAAVNEQNIDMLVQLQEVLEEQRDPMELVETIANMMKEFCEEGKASA